jgi:hypothetical protein
VTDLLRVTACRVMSASRESGFCNRPYYKEIAFRCKGLLVVHRLKNSDVRRRAAAAIGAVLLVLSIVISCGSLWRFFG